MSDAPDRLIESISDGQPADWDAAALDADPARRGRIESLREVSRIADFSRERQRVPADADMPERWGDLLLLERLGSGAHAEVFRAWDAGLRREVALKLMRAGADDTALLNEGRVAARIRDPHVVTVHGVDRRDGRVGLWMELVRGRTLEQRVSARGLLDPHEAARLGADAGAALAAVHAAGLLHRDVKPANVVHDAEGGWVLADFGLGLGHLAGGAPAGVPSGTPMYMAPELLAGAVATERSDVYSLGMLLWFALAGRHPFVVETIDALRDAAAHGPRPGLREARPDLPPALATLVERAIAPDPARRFASARDWLEAIQAWSPERTPARAAARPATRALAAVVAIVALAGVAVFGVWRARRAEPPLPSSAAPPAGAIAPPAGAYEVEATFLRRDGGAATRLVTGDRVKPGDRLSLEVRATRPAWIYVLDEDEHGERYLLFPQPRFDARNPLAPESTHVLPGTVGGQEQGWTVTSAGGREYLLVVASPEPLPEIETDLGRLPAALPGRPIAYAQVGDAALERLRGVGGVEALPPGAARAPARSRAFDRFRALAGRETGVHGVWVRQIVLENPRR